MKTVFSNSEICHVWAHQHQDNGRNSNRSIFFEKGVIYSYGYHFAIAAHYKGMVLVTTRIYSMSTSRHTHKVMEAVTHLDKVFCAYPERSAKGCHVDSVCDWLYQIKYRVDKLKTAKKPVSYMSGVNIELEKMEAYFELFPEAKTQMLSGERLDYSTEQIELYKYVTSKEWKQRFEAEKKLEEKKEAAKNDPELMDARAKKNDERKQKILALIPKVFGEAQTAWREDRLPEYVRELKGVELEAYKKTYTDVRNPHFRSYNNLGWKIQTDYILLRAVRGEVETSKGIKIPLAVAERYFYQLCEKIEKGIGVKGWDMEASTALGWEIQGYKVTGLDSEKLVVGCHTILLSEITLLAQKLGWKISDNYLTFASTNK